MRPGDVALMLYLLAGVVVTVLLVGYSPARCAQLLGRPEDDRTRATYLIGVVVTVPFWWVALAWQSYVVLVRWRRSGRQR